MPNATLTQYLLDVAADAPKAGYAHILSAIAVSVKLTAAAVSRGRLIMDGDADGATTSDQEVGRRLRRFASKALLEQTRAIPQLAGVCFARSAPILGDDPSARYLLVVEALHGPRNLADNLPVGATFSVLERSADHAPQVSDLLQPGRRQVCAGIALYGPRTMLVLTTGNGVDGFTLDRDVGNFVLTHPRLRIPPAGRQFTINAGESPYWPAPVKRYVEECVLGSAGPRGHDFTMRWNASAVVGAYRVLNSGGLFLVPDTGRPTGWLAPLLHTAGPLALLAEQAGGAASTGTDPILDVVPDSPQSSVPLFFGDADEVARIDAYHAEHAQGYDQVFNHPLFGQRSLFID